MIDTNELLRDVHTAFNDTENRQFLIDTLNLALERAYDARTIPDSVMQVVGAFARQPFTGFKKLHCLLTARRKLYSGKPYLTIRQVAYLGGVSEGHVKRCCMISSNGMIAHGRARAFLAKTRKYVDVKRVKI